MISSLVLVFSGIASDQHQAQHDGAHRQCAMDDLMWMTLRQRIGRFLLWPLRSRTVWDNSCRFQLAIGYISRAVLA
ncbi:hypothetical protein CPJ18_23630 [Agrobacterium rosae]|uniref:Uncharacterized protein n=1 Tax=Agrobacterium rosae TaxID=1972867 RepID=A0AAE5VMD1_9HYPH|nr:hypothetical protein DXM21_22025 [Agrobacterium rosae]KAA3513806.1 hypothetical protein DXM25_22215 [Agrobacterium rosae]MQB50816.1 hypothetical protein [Agrobacterium rosae]POO48960.1 hypothetical protein CPJ18_23630 [Agrobacterium rosae]